MRGKLGLALGVGAASALVLVVSLVSVSVAGPNVSRLAVVEHATTDTVVDLTTNGDSTGDLLTFHNELFDAGNENVVGTDQGECVRIEVGVSWECRWINFLERRRHHGRKGLSSMRVPRRRPSPEARERIEERAGACVSCLVTRPGRVDFVFRILTP
jgi:hypothetical protein